MRQTAADQKTKKHSVSELLQKRALQHIFIVQQYFVYNDRLSAIVRKFYTKCGHDDNSDLTEHQLKRD